MRKTSISCLLVLAAIQFPQLACAKERQPPFRINIGYFRFPLNDPDIESRVLQSERNVTLWEKLYDLTHNYWQQNKQALPDDVEIDALRGFGNESKVEKKELDVLLERAKESYDANLASFGNDSQKLWQHNQTDLSEKFLGEIDEEFKMIHHQYLMAWAGVGSAVDCSEHINNMLDQMTEWEKAGMAAASTLMALLPTFLAFGNLFVPRSSEAFATSWLIGLGAALFSLGLPVRSLSCVRRKQVLELATLDKDPLDDISDMGSRDKNRKATELRLQELQEWTNENPPHRYMRDFGRIRKAVGDYVDRYHWWHVPAIFIAASQAVIFGLAIEPLLKAAGIPKFIFACSDTNWTGLYLSISAITNALFRLALWQLCDHEVVSIYDLSSKAKAGLETLKRQDAETTATHLPPLYPPLVSKFHRRFGKLVEKVFTDYKAIPEEHPSGALARPIGDSIDYAVSVLKSPLSILRSGFANTDAAPRWRPLVVLIHLSTAGRPQLRTLFTGFCEAALLLALTFFFASQWGGNLYITSIALALLLVFITVGRALAIVYVWLSARTWGLHTINCDEQDEILGCLRIICSMKGVLVTVNGAHYYDGYRLDSVPEFKAWRRQYAAGQFDQPVTTHGAAQGKKLSSDGNEKNNSQATVTTTPVGQDIV